MSTGANGVVQLENELFRVTEWTIQPGGVIPMHRHDYDYVVVPMVSDKMHVVQADGGEIVAELVAGQSYTRPAGSEHQVENRTSGSPIVFVEIERLA
ncbi:cupin domain-containing protein [Leucobacter sp. HY1910]